LSPFLSPPLELEEFDELEEPEVVVADELHAARMDATSSTAIKGSALFNVALIDESFQLWGRTSCVPSDQSNKRVAGKVDNEPP